MKTAYIRNPDLLLPKVPNCENYINTCKKCLLVEARSAVVKRLPCQLGFKLVENTLPVKVRITPVKTASSSLLKANWAAFPRTLCFSSTKFLLTIYSTSSRCMCLPQGVVVTLKSSFNSSYCTESRLQSILAAGKQSCSTHLLMGVVNAGSLPQA